MVYLTTLSVAQTIHFDVCYRINSVRHNRIRSMNITLTLCFNSQLPSHCDTLNEKIEGEPSGEKSALKKPADFRWRWQS